MTFLCHTAPSFATLFAVAAAAVVAAGPTASAGSSGAVSIASARHRALGSIVTVRGTVTVPSNAFGPGFAIQQGAAGLYVLDSGNASRACGTEVQITGTLVDNFGLLSLQPTSITALGHGRAIRPRKHVTGSVGEATEGRLLRLKGQMVGDLIDDGPFGEKLDIDDGSGPIQLFLYPGTGITTAGLHDGVSIEVVCFSSQFDTHYECDPRTPADLERSSTTARSRASRTWCATSMTAFRKTPRRAPRRRCRRASLSRAARGRRVALA